MVGNIAKLCLENAFERFSENTIIIQLSLPLVFTQI